MEVQTPAEQMLFVTVRIEVDTPYGTGTGTGFIFAYEHGDGGYLFLVTNKHVVADARQGRFFFTKQGSDGNPLIGERHDFTIEDFGLEWNGHPDPGVDITVMHLGPVLEEIQASGHEVFFRAVSNNVVPTPEQVSNLDAVEEVVFIGYPNGIFDLKNLIPVVRRGITATPYHLDYEGEPVFLIDASVFPGSSGSPVFISSQGGYTTRHSGINLLPRLHFLGVIAEVLIRNEDGRIDFEPIPTAQRPIVRTRQMIDLGVVYKASAVVHTIEDGLRQSGIIS